MEIKKKIENFSKKWKKSENYGKKSLNIKISQEVKIIEI